MNTAACEIVSRLPHKQPFLFVDEVVQIAPGANGTAVWRVRGDEPFFAGHFPGQPIVPGVLIVEALAQLSGLVVLNGRPMQGRLAHVDVRFEQSVAPPATIDLTSRLVRSLGSLRQFEVKATCAGVGAARGTVTLSGAS